MRRRPFRKGRPLTPQVTRPPIWSPLPLSKWHSHLNCNVHADARTRLEAADNASQPSAAVSTVDVQSTIGSCRTYPNFITDRCIWNHHDPLIPSYSHFMLSAFQHYHSSELCSISLRLAAKFMSEGAEFETVQSVKGRAAKRKQPPVSSDSFTVQSFCKQDIISDIILRVAFLGCSSRLRNALGLRPRACLGCWS